jgi:sulfur relay (sulfurtransferase) DsrC/TusE family protein
MPDKTINGTTITVDDDGFMTDHSQWTKEVAAGLAEEEGSP